MTIAESGIFSTPAVLKTNINSDVPLARAKHSHILKVRRLSSLSSQNISRAFKFIPSSEKNLSKPFINFLSTPEFFLWSMKKSIMQCLNGLWQSAIKPVRFSLLLVYQILCLALPCARRKWRRAIS